MAFFETAVPAMESIRNFALRRFSLGDPEMQRRGGAKYAELTPLPQSGLVMDENTHELIVSNLQRNVSHEIRLLYGSTYEVTATAKIIGKTSKRPQLELTVSIYEPGRRP